MVDVFQTMGPGILTGCITTAAAFVMTLFTDFTGVAEMGLIASVGVLLCLISMGTTFPALVRLIKPAHRHVKPMTGRVMHLYEDRWFMPFADHPRLTLGIAAVLTLSSLGSLWWMKFDYNLLKLQASGMESVEWERKLWRMAANRSGSAYPSCTTCRRHAGLLLSISQQPTVGLVRGDWSAHPGKRDTQGGAAHAGAG
ncbi:MAG: hypothetical protein HC898_04605 [Phycisphaerales bacterium]|nr:hypothetical protein [Phycisphaerales bacterium]